MQTLCCQRVVNWVISMKGEKIEFLESCSVVMSFQLGEWRVLFFTEMDKWMIKRCIDKLL